MLYPPDSSFISLGGVTLHFYGIIVAISIIVCLFVLEYICKRIKTQLSSDIFYDILPPIILISILGARLYYVALNYTYYFSNPKEIFMLWQGGLSIHGAILAGLLTIILLLKLKKVKILPYLDVIACILPLGQAIGRWGNFVNQEAFGTPCNYFWCMYIAPVFRPLKYKSHEFFHPAFLYESVLDFLIFIVLFVLLKQCRMLKHGIISGLYLVFYSFARIIVEIIRTDASYYIFNVPFPLFVSVIFLMLGVLLITYIYKK